MSKYIMTLDKLTGYIHEYGSDTVIGKLNDSEVNILCALHYAKGATVERDALVVAGWPGRVVGPNSLNMAINKIRKIISLAANGDEKVYLHTVPRRGFKLTPSVVSLVTQATYNEVVTDDDFTCSIISPKENEAIVGSKYIKERNGGVQKKVSVFMTISLLIILPSIYLTLKTHTSSVELYCHIENNHWMCGLDNNNKCNEGKAPKNNSDNVLKGDVYVYGESCEFENAVKVISPKN